MLDLRLTTYAVTLFAGVSFLVCVVFALIMPEGYGMHAFLEAVLPFFQWISLVDVVIGLLQSLVLGAYVGFVYAWIHNALYQRMAVKQVG